MNCFSNSQRAYEREDKDWTEYNTEQKHIPPGVPGSLTHLNKVSGRWQEAFGCSLSAVNSNYELYTSLTTEKNNWCLNIFT